MNKILVVTLLCVAAASAATKTKTSGAASKRGFGIGTHDAHPEVVTVGGHGGGGGGGEGWGAPQQHGDYPALADIVALVLNLLVLAAFGGLVYMLLSPLLSDGHDGWGRSTGSPYFDTAKDSGIMSRVLNSIDYVDTTFAVMKIQGDGCRKRIACEMERTAGRNKIFNYATGWFRKQMRSMDFYKEAVSTADEHKDCAIQYPDCTYTLVDKVGKWVSN